MNRRHFITGFGVGWVASSLPVAIAACSSQASGNWQSVGTLEELEKKGQLLDKNSPLGPVMVVDVSTTNLVAVNPTCTHAGCTVEWKGNAKKWQSVGTLEELEKKGQLLDKNSPLGPVMVVDVSTTNLVAVNPTCTHAGCTVEWKGNAKKFQCPCHGAEFGIDGKVQKGPATKALKIYAAKIEGKSVLVK